MAGAEEKSLSALEQAWLRRQERKRLRAAASKYVPHQGKRERARRLKRMETA